MPDRSPRQQQAGLRCIRCGKPKTIILDLADLSRFQCRACKESFTTADVAELVESWNALLAWIENAPQQGKQQRSP
jgi:hypothetical protein